MLIQPRQENPKFSSSTYDDSEEENNYGAGGGAGELAHSLQKLKQFRHFYVVVVCYIYFTRIVVYLADSTLGYKLAWLSYVGSEIATLLFYIISGYYFVPARNNPYFQIGSVDQL
jgi:NADH:ubiquinone oxidoreductase subunit 3 (subunit A)